MVKLVSEVQILLKLYKPLTLLLKKQNQWLVQQVLKIVLYPCNIVSESQNVVQLVQKLETAKFKELFLFCTKQIIRGHHHFLLLIYILILLYRVLCVMVITRWPSL